MGELQVSRLGDDIKVQLMQSDLMSYKESDTRPVFDIELFIAIPAKHWFHYSSSPIILFMIPSWLTEYILKWY